MGFLTPIAKGLVQAAKDAWSCDVYGGDGSFEPAGGFEDDAGYGSGFGVLGAEVGLFNHEQDRVNPANGSMLNYGPTNTPLGEYDPLSVMIHPDDPKLVPAGTARKQNLVLSEQDKRRIATLYPGRWSPSVGLGEVRG